MAEEIVQPKRRNLFVIEAEAQEIATAFDRLEEGGTEEEFTASVMAYFGDLMLERDRKIDAYASLIRASEAHSKILKGEAAPYQDEADRLKAKAKTKDNLVKRLKNLLVIWMKSIDMKTIETPAGNKVTRQNNPGALVIAEGAKPEIYKGTPYVIVTYEWDKEAIRADLETGEELPFAKIEIGEHARLK